ncbi:Lysine--tRNA ligase [Frankliniella fusca]|uniref:Lysine--tRNA ligase n=1 Tax=Frankliniella fusca TaxID=407009 RepID=A0AAE1LKW7_9NEOP|nr:Lysine--tRNA ligase [Frankliniella fusca]
MKFSHSYFATSHGKSQCDADGGTVKRQARRASLQRPLEKQIINATHLFSFCKEEMSDKFHFLFVNKSDVDPIRAIHKDGMKALSTVPGTRSFHFVKPETDNRDACWRISNDQHLPPALVHSLLKPPTTQKEQLAISCGSYVIVRLARNRYVGLVTDIYEDEEEVDVSLLMPRLPAKDFSWPSEMNECEVGQRTVGQPNSAYSIHHSLMAT